MRNGGAGALLRGWAWTGELRVGVRQASAYMTQQRAYQPSDTKVVVDKNRCEIINELRTSRARLMSLLMALPF